MVRGTVWVGRLIHEHGHRWVPVELGRWPCVQEDLITIACMVERFLLGHSKLQLATTDAVSHDPTSVAYIAQHALFEQIPSLRDHISTPALISGLQGVTVRDVNLWWGTTDTRTPLHYDTYDNFLCQVGDALCV